jgi:hypothetical protein
MKNKKGSMELGINAIVVLIIALALLGLGIGFVTKLFSASQSKMIRIIDRTDLPIHADSLNPIVFDTSTITVKEGRSSPLIVSVYNPGLVIGSQAAVKAGECVDSSGAVDSTGKVNLGSPAQDIPPGTDVGFSVSVSAATGAAGTTGSASYICTVHAPYTLFDGSNSYDPSKQLFIEVVN